MLYHTAKLRAGAILSLGHSPPFYLSVSGHSNTVSWEWGRGEVTLRLTLPLWLNVMSVSSVKAGEFTLLRKYIVPPISYSVVNI